MSASDQLVTVDGFAFPVLASRGSEDRARRLGRRCQAAREFLRERLGVSPPIVVWVLSEPDWTAFGSSEVYGMPHFEHGSLYVAGQPAAFWGGLARALSDVSADVRREVEGTYGAGGAIDLGVFFDLLVVHELTHAFLAELPYGLGRRWLDELFCNLALHEYVVDREPAEVERLTVFPRAYLSLDAAGFRRDLRYFETTYSAMPATNYAWYQCRLHTAAAELHAADSGRALGRLWAMGREADALLAGQLQASAGAATASVLTAWPA